MEGEFEKTVISAVEQAICECTMTIGTTLKEAIGKQVDKKPISCNVELEKIKIGNGYWCKGTTVYRCSTCGDFVTMVQNYCHKCGQKIDWEAESFNNGEE